ncbi:hypothetical protein KQI88_09530 [Alkaliphilus sp. MSJ-5]|uniref:DUF8042 domain-containing protein n=1 Tax=Alkaliphilus flagellatus TaxID=2841507 RepID=A0ABS6G2G8_9FIRM|nr:hypothetical protein [Alkaliphilus flagellatus]MBU5676659.1 hypothetical protein [Alkaliphilus flagellatus]
MKIHILNQTLEYENNQNIIDDVFKQINKKVSNSNLIFSHLYIDGQDIYSDFYDYFLDNIKVIQEVKVITKTVKELSEEIMLSTLDYIERAVPEIEILSNEFYKTPTQSTWNKLSDLFEGFNWIISSFVGIDSNTDLKNIINNYEEWNIYAQNVYSLKDLIVEFEDIMQNNDLVSVADILSYEIIPLFNSMKEKLEKLVYREANLNANDR